MLAVFVELSVSTAGFFFKLFENKSRKACIITGFTARKTQGEERFVERRSEEVPRKGTENGQSRMSQKVGSFILVNSLIDVRVYQ